MDYKQAGVDIDKGNALVERIKPLAQSTERPGVLSSIGGFAALFELPKQNYQQPVMVSATDGVGTKLKLAQQLNNHRTIGIDLVAMCVNDLIVCGAEPLFFLDYYATGKLHIDCASDVIAGIAEGCRQAHCSLSGGETAEMPGMYQGEDYDLAGFAVGIVEKNAILDGTKIREGDTILGLASSGLHSNGYSLVRHIINEKNIELSQLINDQPLADILLTPTKIYVKTILSAQQHYSIHGLAHITGGGFIDNIPRILPANLAATINLKAWQRPAIFDFLQQAGDISEDNMLTTFNCGIGMVMIVPSDQALAIKQHCEQQGDSVFEIGQITARQQQAVVVTNT